MLILSPFGQGNARASAALAQARNAFVAALADAVLVPYATPGGRTEALCRSIISSGKRLYVLDTPDNTPLVAWGASPLRTTDIGPLLANGVSC